MNRSSRLRRLRRLALYGIAAGALALGGVPATVTTAAAQMSHMQRAPKPLLQAAPRPAPQMRAAPPVSRVAPRRAVVPRIAAPRIPVQRPQLRLDRAQRDAAPAAHEAPSRRIATPTLRFDAADAPALPRRPLLVVDAPSPPPRPVELDARVAQVAQARGIQEAREAALAALAGLEQAPSDLGGLGDPLRPETERATAEDAAMRDAMKGFDAIRGLGGGGVDSFALVTDLGLPSNHEGRSEPAGLRLDPTTLATDGLARNDDDGPIANDPSSDDEGVVNLEVEGDDPRSESHHPDGSRSVNRRTRDEHGFYSETVVYDENGNVVSTSYVVVAPNNWTRWGERLPDGTHRFIDVRDDGHVVRRVTEPPHGGGVDRLLTGEEGGGGWCGPSGWGCSAPQPASEALAGAGRIVNPGDDDTQTGSGPRLRAGADDLLGNPDIHREGPSSGRSARHFDGGALVNPGDAD